MTQLEAIHELRDALAKLINATMTDDRNISHVEAMLELDKARNNAIDVFKSTSESAIMTKATIDFAQEVIKNTPDIIVRKSRDARKTD